MKSQLTSGLWKSESSSMGGGGTGKGSVFEDLSAGCWMPGMERSG